MCRTRGRPCRPLLLIAALALVGCTPRDDPAWAASGSILPVTSTAQAQVASPTPDVPTLTPTPQPIPTPAPTAEPPPALIATYPVSGDRAVAADRSLILVFDRAMDRASVQAALHISPEVDLQFTWQSDAQVTLASAEPWQQDTDYEVTLSADAQTPNGTALAQAPTLHFGSGGRGAPIPVLMYHHFTALDADATQGQRDWAVSPQALGEQLAYLRAHDWHTISPTQLADYLGQGAPLPLRPLLITIDDGYKEILDVAELFIENDLQPVLFVVTDYVEYGAYLDWQQLAELAAQGFYIGSHSVDHRDLREADEQELQRQIADSKALLEAQLGVQVDAFCYPFGSLNARTKEVVAESGYRTGFSLNPTIYQAPDDLLFLGRSRVDYATTLDDFIALLPD